VPSLDDQIDDLYRLPLAEFTGARNALAKTVRGAEATRVRTLEKPTIVAWAVNQVHWHAPSTFDRLMTAGARLRQAQIAALTGRSADLREASDAHHRAIGDAVREAERLAGEAGSHPASDALRLTFETLSLAEHPPDHPGRLSGALQPAGFETLAGVTPVARPQPERPSAAERRKQAEEERRRAAEERKRAAEIRKAETAFERAKAKLRAAEAVLKRTRDRS